MSESIHGNEFEGLNTGKRSLSRRLRDSLRRKFGKKTNAEKFRRQAKKNNAGDPFKNMPHEMRGQGGGKRKKRKTRRKPKRTRRTKRRTRKSRR